MSIRVIIVATRTKVLAVLLLMTLPPFMAVTMDGAVIIVTDFAMLSFFFFAVWFMIRTLGFLGEFIVLVVTIKGCFYLRLFVEISCFFTMGVGLCLLLNHVGLQGFKRNLMNILSRIDEICSPVYMHRVIEESFDFFCVEDVRFIGCWKLGYQSVDVFQPVQELGHCKFVILANSLQRRFLYFNC